MLDLKKINTETRNEKTINLDLMSASEIVKVINEEDANIQKAINEKLDEISAVVEAAAEAIRNGGRIIYTGAGTSGRLGVLDAVECPPTYGVSDQLVIGLIAGGEKAFIKAQEGAEDSKELAVTDLKDIELTTKDLVVGIAASGRTPYVIGGLEYANEIGATTASIAITNDSAVGKVAKFPIEVVVGPEVVTGSTRMKAGTAQKMILNMISTGAMVLNGKVYQNLMVDVMQTNEKLVVRAQNIVIEATGCEREVAKEYLQKAEGSSKLAICMILNDIDKEQAIAILEKNKGNLRKSIN
ncbi:N-acetylmuramic acid 6-phosphate etherase [Mollicutes bacterium LVI A0078]|nr:N-acetylmuramic acid 6-phosphate etherase [Mollicutes bacterium LVI A0075]WOO91375.1 N-acetylmuramic acid 6-phosphate etherase [Mollicutes bacterium LVI A0078]